MASCEVVQHMWMQAEREEALFNCTTSEMGLDFNVALNCIDAILLFNLLSFNEIVYLEVPFKFLDWWGNVLRLEYIPALAMRWKERLHYLLVYGAFIQLLAF